MPDYIQAASITGTAALVAAAIAAVASLGATLAALLSSWLTNRTSARNFALQAKIAQQIKHADFRQAWINDLRQAMVSLQTVTMEGDRVKLDNVAAFAQALQILLRMNPKDPNYSNLVKKVNDILKGEQTISRDDWLSAQADYISLCQTILKTEWDVLKNDLNDLSYVKPIASGKQRREPIPQQTDVAAEYVAGGQLPPRDLPPTDAG